MPSQDDLAKRLSRLSPAKRALLDRKLRENASASQILPITRRANADPAPLSFGQQRLWFLDQWEPGSNAYNVSMAIHLEGILNVAALERSLTEILNRHEVLRTTYSADGDQPVQTVHPPAPFTLRRIDLRALEMDEREAQAQRLASEEAERPFDLVTGPLMRAVLLQKEAQKHALILTIHHIATDGWSMSVLYLELASLYEAFLNGGPSPLRSLPIQYADFAEWQRRRLQGGLLERDLTYWREQLRGLATLELPTDHPRPPTQTFHGGRHLVQMPPALAQSLQSLCRQEGATLFMTLLAAVQALLARYTGQEDIVVGTPIAGRTCTELEGLIGFFVNMLVVRADVSGDPTFRELLARVRQVAVAAYEHQDIPFEKLVEELHPQRAPSRNPLFQVVFALHNAPRSNPSLPGLTISRMDLDSSRVRFDLEVHFTESRDGLRGLFVYNTDLFEAATIARMAGHFQTMLEGIAADPDQRLSLLPLLTENERRQVLVEWNDTATSYPRDACIHELFEAQAQATPDATAVIFEHQRLTYRELNERANQLAHYLRRHGVGPDVLVGICVARSIEMLVGLLGILKAGGAYVPLDPSYPKERLAFMLKDTAVRVLLTQQRFLANLPQTSAKGICLDAEQKEIEQESLNLVHSGASADSLAYVIYTSGSTGTPKGVSVVHRGVVRLVKGSNYFDVQPDEVFLQFAPLSFDASTFEIWGSLLNGAQLVIFPPQAPSLEELGQVIQHHRITTLWLTAALFQRMVDGPLDSLGGVRQLLAGGDVLSAPHGRKFLQRHPCCRLINGYGPTETTTFACCHPMTRPEQIGESVSIGRPIANTQVYILDRHLQPVPIGVIGELHIGGDGLARGYLNRAELTVEKFIPAPFGGNPRSRLYKTGDLARYRSDGNIEFSGRMDHQVKIRGFRVELGEIETVLLEHPGVAQAIVTAQISPTDDKHLVAYVVPSTGARPSLETLRQFLRDKLPDYMVPSAFVFLDSFPLTPSGKVDRQALPDREPERPQLDTTFAEPHTTVEERVAGVWSGLLGIDRVGIHDNFFDLGGHSLLAIQLISRLQQMFQIKIPVRTLFDSPTVAQLAARIEESRQGDGEVEPTHQKTWIYLVPIQKSGAQRPLFLVPGGGGGEDEFLVYARLARFVGDDFPFYGLQARGCDGQREPHTRVEQMARDYIKEIRSFQPEGPYHLAGECVGGIVAYEMAGQLVAQGQKVALLLLLDTQRPTTARYLRHSIGALRTWWRYYFANRFARHWKKLRQMEPRERPRYFLDKALKSVFVAAYALRLMRLPDPEGKLEVVQHIERVRAGYPRSLLRYKPKPYEVRVSLITNESWYQHDPIQDWADLALGGIDLIRVPGNHRSYIRADAQTTATHLRACLEKAATNQD